MNDPTFIRGVALMFPLLATGLVWLIVRPTRRVAAGALLATLWNFAALVPLNLLAVRVGWWSFNAEGGLFLSVPFDLLLGWALLWGPLPVVAMSRAPQWIVVALLLWIDLLAMPRMAPVLMLGDAWLLGEVLAVSIALVPGLLLARWTRDEARLTGRSTLQLVLFASLVYGLLPAVILAQRGRGWATLLDRPAWLLAIAAQTLAIPLILGLAALHRFVTLGGGTPLPYDPPKRLVTGGPYAYIANPMQWSTALVLVGWGLLIGEPLVTLAGPMAVVFCWGVATWHEEAQLTARFGESWRRYRTAVRTWLPRWRPYVGEGPSDRLYVAASCDACAAVGAWFAARSAAGLVILPAEAHPTRRLRRIRYESANSESAWDGIAAVARALERVHLGWAFVGWCLALPLVRHAAQTLVDAVGGGPRPPTKKPADAVRGLPG